MVLSEVNSIKAEEAPTLTLGREVPVKVPQKVFLTTPSEIILRLSLLQEGMVPSISSSVNESCGP